MNYLEWANEYKKSAEQMLCIINKLKELKKNCKILSKKEIDIKISKYKTYYVECMQAETLLLNRYKGVG